MAQPWRASAAFGLPDRHILTGRGWQGRWLVNDAKDAARHAGQSLPARTGSWKAWPVAAILLGSIAFSMYAVGVGQGFGTAQRTDDGSRSWVTPMAAQGPDTSWIPAGFTDLKGDATAAYRATAPLDPSCSAGTQSCTGLEIITRDGCPDGFWLQMRVINRMGGKAGEGWAVGPPVLPKEITDVTVQWEGQPSNTYDIYNFDCRWNTVP